MLTILPLDLLLKHVPIPTRTTLCRKGRCTATWCPLDISWATTIHKFQGFEAGFGDNDMFRHSIIDPGDKKWEQACPGALCMALSRAKTVGTFTSDTDCPLDSAICWHGSGISKILDIERTHEEQQEKRCPRRKCLPIAKREKWVEHLHKKEFQTKAKPCNESDKTITTPAKHSQAEAKEQIAAMITTPNKSWAKRKTTTAQHSKKLLWSMCLALLHKCKSAHMHLYEGVVHTSSFCGFFYKMQKKLHLRHCKCFSTQNAHDGISMFLKKPSPCFAFPCKTGMSACLFL